MVTITINKRLLREQLMLSLASFLDPAKYGLSELAIKISNEIEECAINQQETR